MKKKEILMYLSSFILLAISFIMFIFAFVYVTRKGFYVISGVTLLAFCVMNKLTEKKIRCADGYNLLQAYFFYLKCEKSGVDIKPGKVKHDELVIIAEIAGGYDYCKDFDESKLKELYKCGREVRTILKEK